MTATPDESQRLLREGACARLVDRDAVIVRGSDARSWLQGQLSQDLDPLEPGGSAETLVLSPQGKIDAACRVTVIAAEVVLLDTEPGYGDQLAVRLRRFRLRVRAELESGTVRCLSIRGPLATVAGITGAPPPGTVAPVAREGAAASWLDGSWAVTVRAEWPGFAGLDVLGPPGGPIGPVWPVEGLVEGDAGAFEAARIEAGVPLIGRELGERTIPQEAGALVEHAVSFTKGCYTGQELVARLDARGGNVAKRLRGCVLGTEAEVPEIGTELEVEGREVGRLTSAAWSPGFGRPVALAYVRRDVVPPAHAELAGGLGGVEIRELPLTIN